jgi:XapX domain-containing protein
MKAMLISFAVGLIVGEAYGLLRVKSPAPPRIALAGLLGMVWGEQAAERFFLRVPPSASAKNKSGGNGTSHHRSSVNELDTVQSSAGPSTKSLRVALNFATCRSSRSSRAR